MFDSPKRLAGILTILTASLGLGFIMFYPRLLPIRGLEIGALLTAFITFGIFLYAGAIKVIPRKIQPSHPQQILKPSRLVDFVAGFNVPLLWLSLALFWAGVCRISVIGTLGASFPMSGPVLFCFGLAMLILARLKKQDEFDGNLHEGLLVLLVATASIMSTLGSQGLWDCWETHYGEVARRQLEQDDWISLFWERKWFYSKPILIFWMMNLGMLLVGADVRPDSISSHIEWGVRLPVGILAIIVIWAMYQLLARRFSKRAGIFAAIIIATMPLFSFMARQAITDMPFVGFMTLAVILFLLGITTDPGALVQGIRIPVGKTKALVVSGFHAVISGYVFFGLTQFIYLGTRSSVFHFGTLGMGNIRDQMSDGAVTGLNLSDIFSSVVGVNLNGPVDISLDWFLLGLSFAVPFFFILHTLRNERRVSVLCFHGMYISLALSVMAKGLPGLAMPILGLMGLWIFYSPWTAVFKKSGIKNFLLWNYDKAKRLDLIRGIPMFFLVASPWYIAMFVRHGMSFINRFFIHDHLKRLSSGVHGDTGTIQYFVEQFSYAAFPWAALLPFALLSFHVYSKNKELDGERLMPGDEHRKMILIFVTFWGFLSFGLLSMMVTKFHHYTFPLIPPAVISIAIFLDNIWEGRIKRTGPVVITGLAIIALTAKDLFGTSTRGVLQGCAKFVGLFIYKYSRPYPKGEQYDYTTTIMIFSAIFFLLLAAWVLKKWRRAAIVATMITALAFGHWVTQHYMVALAPHWTQKHLIAEYYDKRTSTNERLVAFQMNWKGENFYTGNRALIYASTKNKDFDKWADKHRGERHFFITEQSRFSRMSRRAKPASGDIIPLEDTCNKYKIGVADKL